MLYYSLVVTVGGRPASNEPAHGSIPGCSWGCLPGHESGDGVPVRSAHAKLENKFAEDEVSTGELHEMHPISGSKVSKQGT